MTRLVTRPGLTTTQLNWKVHGCINRNKTAQANCLILEPICQNPVTQADAIKACRDFHSQVEVPKGHVHVKVLGSYVLDSEADHGWMEIHPVTSMVPE